MQNFMIGPTDQALRKDLKPFAIPENSFETMTNAYQFRGRIIKRTGYSTLGRLANGTPVMGLRTYENFGIGQQTLIAFDTTQAYEWNGTSFVNLPSQMPVTWSGTDINFFYTVNYANAFWTTNNVPGLNGWAVEEFTAESGTGTSATVVVKAPGNTAVVGDFVYFLNLSGGSSGSANNLIFGQITFINVPGTTFTVQAITYPPGVNSFTNGTVSSGYVLDSMQTVSGQDGIRYYGILSNGTGWANYNPPINPTTALLGALFIFPYRGYLVFLNTWEGNSTSNAQNFGNRARWTQIGTPYYSQPVPVFPNSQTVDFNAARDDIFGRGGANDAPTDEVIVSAGFIRDILVVFFERSTWRLRFVNNVQNPFVWERVNVEFGSSCPFSSIIFDKGLIAISNRGIVISDGNDTVRFDEKIPDDIFKIRQANSGLQRVQGIRTFRTKLNYWTYPSVNNPNGIYPDYVLVFNYETKNWSYFDDCFTCFGYYYETGTGLTWDDLPDDWSSYNDISWDSGQDQSGYENIVAGNQQGYVFVLEKTSGQNDVSLSIISIIGNVFTSNNNNLPDGTWITLTGVTGTTSDDGVSLNGRSFKVINPTLSANSFSLSEFKRINGQFAVGVAYTYTIGYINILPGSIQINVGSLVFKDINLNGVLTETTLGVSSGVINYDTGVIILNFNPAILSTQVWIRVVSLDPLQGLDVVNTTGGYGGGGQIIKISNIDIRTKQFNFFADDKRARLSQIDFYLDPSPFGQFTANVLADSSNEAVNTPLPDNPLSNVVMTQINPYQVGQGSETIYRLFCETLAQTLQLQLTYSDYQMAVPAYNQAPIELLALIFKMRRGGRLV